MEDNTNVDPDEIEVVALIDPQSIEELLEALGIAIKETEHRLENLFADEEEKTAKEWLKWLGELEEYLEI